MNPLPPRMYHKLWCTIRDKGTCSIAAPRNLHLRIIKAVQKEKWMDMGYKFLIAEDRCRTELKFKRKGTTVEFKIKIIPDPTDI